MKLCSHACSKHYAWLLILLAFSALAFPARAAEGSSNANDAAVAEQLFLEGKRLLNAGETAAACEKLSASYAVEAGLGTLLLLGHCYEALGKTASAWAQFRSAESFAKAANQPRRAEIARLRALALEAQLSRLTLLRPKNGAVADYEIRRDGKVVPLASLDVALPVDPGTHVIEVSAPGKQPQRLSVDVPAGARTTQVTLPVLVALKTTAVPPSAPPTKGLQRSERPLPPSSPIRWPAYVSGAAGIAGVAVGATFGVLAKSSYDDSAEFCRTATLCSKRGLELRETAEERARVATITFAAGGALLATAVVLWIVPPHSEPARAGAPARGLRLPTAMGLSPTVSAQTATLNLTGAW